MGEDGGRGGVEGYTLRRDREWKVWNKFDTEATKKRGNMREALLPLSRVLLPRLTFE